MQGWLALAAAIAAEVAATSALKAADGFTRLWPSLAVASGYAVAFLCLSVAIRTVPVGVAYAVWSGVGTVAIAIIGRALYGQRLDTPALAGIILIVAGVALVNLSRTGVPG